MRRIVRFVAVTAVILFFGLLTSVAIGVLAWVVTAWPSYAREDRTHQLVLLSILMACLAGASIAILFKVIRPTSTPEAQTSPAVMWLAFAASATFGLVASVYSGEWEIAAGVGVAMLSALAKLAMRKRPDQHADAA